VRKVSVEVSHCNLPKVTALGAILKTKVYSTFFFTEATNSGMMYLDKLKLWLQLRENFPGHLFL
jgi:hypothetical protein